MKEFNAIDPVAAKFIGISPSIDEALETSNLRVIERYSGEFPVIPSVVKRFNKYIANQYPGGLLHKSDQHLFVMSGWEGSPERIYYKSELFPRTRKKVQTFSGQSFLRFWPNAQEVHFYGESGNGWSIDHITSNFQDDSINFLLFLEIFIYSYLVTMERLPHLRFVFLAKFRKVSILAGQVMI